MSSRPRIPSLNDQLCQVCSSSSLDFNGMRNLSGFSCNLCGLSMCYGCYEKHTNQLTNGNYQNHFIYQNLRLSNEYNTYLQSLIENKKEYFGQYQENCIRNVNATFDEVFNDLESLRRQSIGYVKQQFLDAEINLLEIIKNIKPMSHKLNRRRTHDGLTKSRTFPIDMERKILLDAEEYLDTFSTPTLKIKMSTYPRHKLSVQCDFLPKTFTSKKEFSTDNRGKSIVTRCSFGAVGEFSNDKIEVETNVEEFSSNMFDTKQTQTESLVHVSYDKNYEDSNLKNETKKLHYFIDIENCMSNRFVQDTSIYTQNKVDRIASDGEHVLYYSDTSKSLCHIRNFLRSTDTSLKQMAQEISCRWPYQSIVDLIYSPVSSEYICANKSGIYKCCIKNSIIDIKIQFTQICSYVRLAADRSCVWIWTDTSRTNELRIYEPLTFTCIKVFCLNDYPRFIDNSTTFCIHSNILATLFQYKSITAASTSRKIFHLILSDSTDLRELCTIRLDECDIDHEIRASNNGLFFMTNGREKLWIVDQSGRKEFVQLNSVGRALTVLERNYVIIANGTQQLQCVKFLHK